MDDKEIEITIPNGRKRRLKSAQDCRRFLADLVHRLDNDLVDGQKASKLAYIVNILLAAVRTDEVESRLSELEKLLQNRK
jgi:hypothetical protein